MAHEDVYWNGGHTDGGYTDESYTTHDGMTVGHWVSKANCWNKGAGNELADLVYRPVIVDALGRKKPIVSFNPSNNTETYYKPSGNIISRSDSFDDDYYRRNDGTKEPTITNSNGRGRANHAEWATPPGSNLTRPTSDIGAAVEILKEVARPSSGQHGRFATPASTLPKYKETIDSREAAMRYGYFKPTSRSYSTGAEIIDSKTAQEKYKGAIVP